MIITLPDPDNPEVALDAVILPHLLESTYTLLDEIQEQVIRGGLSREGCMNLPIFPELKQGDYWYSLAYADVVYYRLAAVFFLSQMKCLEVKDTYTLPWEFPIAFDIRPHQAQTLLVHSRLTLALAEAIPIAANPSPHLVRNPFRFVFNGDQEVVFTGLKPFKIFEALWEGRHETVDGSVRSQGYYQRLDALQRYAGQSNPLSTQRAIIRMRSQFSEKGIPIDFTPSGEGTYRLEVSMTTKTK